MGKVLVPKNAVPVPQSKEEAAKLITDYGTLLRKIDAIDVETTQKIADINAAAVAAAFPYVAKAEELFDAIEAYCTSNRRELTGEKRKSVNFGTGTVSWRVTPASVSFEGKAEDLIKLIENSGAEYAGFLRDTVAVNKVAMLRNPNLAEKIKGVKVEAAGEVFAIKPFADEELKEIA